MSTPSATIDDPGDPMHLTGKRVLVIISGGIAAFKALEVIRLLARRGIATRAVLTEAARQFVTPLSVGALTGDTVYSDLFDLTTESDIGHIELSRSADLILVVPATANIIARMACGLCDDLASTVLLATDTDIVLAPAMNVRMWQHAATQRNLATVRGDGVFVVEPAVGDMACGEHGPGRLPEPEVICQAVVDRLGSTAGTPTRSELAGKHVLITSGPTHEPIDPVRYLANRSSGKQGHAIAAAARQAGARVTLVSGPVSLPDPPNVDVVNVETADQMLAAVQEALPVDIAIFAAAVADWRVASTGSQKLKKTASNAPPALTLTENPDILRSIASLAMDRGRPELVIGFAAETDNLIEHARRKLTSKNCDWIVANDVSVDGEVAGGVMGGGRNRVHIITETEVEDWPEMSKDDIAQRLINRVANTIKQAGKQAGQA